MAIETSRNATVATHHPKYDAKLNEWIRIRDCLEGEDRIKSKQETYLPRPSGMAGAYASAYDAYIERAHFPLVVSYALTGALGIIITKIPEFNVPKQMEYILKEATKDGRSLRQLFLDVIIEVFKTGRVPLLVDIIPDKNEFRFVQYTAEEFINWKLSDIESERNLTLGVFTENVFSSADIFSHESETVYRVLSLDEEGNYISRVYEPDRHNSRNFVEDTNLRVNPNYHGSKINEIPLYMAGSINNSFDIQPIPLISVANCSIKIYRKEADLANSEFLSCNPTLVLVGVSNDDNLPNVVGSSVMMVIPNDQARVFYTETDTAALTHVKEHISDLYDEAIRHGVAILDARKGVESAEALRIRQATQSATIYSIYLSALVAIEQGLKTMCKWAGFNEDDVDVDAPKTLIQGIPDASILKAVVEGFGKGVIPLPVIHRYLVASGLIDQTISFDEYVELIKNEEYEKLINRSNQTQNTQPASTDNTDPIKTVDPSGADPASAGTEA